MIIYTCQDGTSGSYAVAQGWFSEISSSGCFPAYFETDGLTKAFYEGDFDENDEKSEKSTKKQ